MKYVIILLFVLFPFSLFAQDASSIKLKADKAYSLEQYEAAAKLYEGLTKNGVSMEVYYNLANCYYRMDDIGHAILWYERALVVNPSDADVRFNLQMARTKTTDKIVPEEEIFFTRWYHSLLNMMSVSSWVWCSIIFFAIMLSGFVCYLTGTQLWLRKFGFYGAIVMLFLVLLCNLFAWQQQSILQNSGRAIVMSSAVVVKSTPTDAGTDLFLLHSGTSVQILDDSMDDWRQIRLSDGKEGWIPTSEIEMI